MGDFNAKIGTDNIAYQEVMGQNGLCVMNDIGERLVDLSALNRLVLGGSVFPKEGFTRQRICHQKTRLTTSAWVRNVEDHLRM